MKNWFLTVFLTLSAVVSAVAQNEVPTLNWPYLYPDFMEGELVYGGGKTSKVKCNIHLGLGALHIVDNGNIGETSTVGVYQLIIGDKTLLNVGGKMMEILAQSEGGFVVQETLANYSAVVRNDGAYGGSLSNAAKGFSYDENIGNYGYLVTNVYEDLLSIKNEAEELPVTNTIYMVIESRQVQANKKSVTNLDGVDKKAFSEFLKANGIKWKNPQDLIKVVDYISAVM